MTNRERAGAWLKANIGGRSDWALDRDRDSLAALLDEVVSVYAAGASASEGAYLAQVKENYAQHDRLKAAYEVMRSVRVALVMARSPAPTTAAGFLLNGAISALDQVLEVAERERAELAPKVD